MAKVYTYIIIITLMSTLLYFAGLDTGMGLILEATGLIEEPENFESSSFFGEFYSSTAGFILLGLSVATIAVGFVTRQPIESLLILPIVGTLLLFIGDYASLLLYFKNNFEASWTYPIISIIFIPLIVGYFVAMVEWWRGVD